MTTHDPIPARLAALKTTPVPELKQQWRELFDSEPPPFSRRYLESRPAFRIQKLAYVGLKPERFRRLERLGEELDGGDTRKPSLCAGRDCPINGMPLPPEWLGIAQSVTVIAEVLDWLAQDVHVAVSHYARDHRNALEPASLSWVCARKRGDA